MLLDQIQKGMTLYTVLTDDPNGEPITQLIRGLVTAVGDDYTYGFSCDWQWAGGKVDWCEYPAAVVFADAAIAIEAYLADRASVLWRDAADLLEDNVVIPNGWSGPDWRGHHDYQRRSSR